MLLAFAWPASGGLAPLIFFAWVPLLMANERYARSDRSERPKNFMPYVFLALAVWNALTTWWLFCVSESMGTKLFAAIGPNVGNVLLMSIPLMLARVARRLGGRWLGAISFIMFWIGFERFHLDWDLSWPWLTLGNVFANDVAWIQWYEWTGHLGGSLWVLTVNLLLASTLLRWNTGPVKWKLLLGPTLLLFVPLLGSLVYDHCINGAPARTMEVVLVQPNIDPYGGKFEIDPLVQLDGMLAQANTQITDSTTLVVLPETALQEDFDLENREGRLVRMGLWENDIGASESVHRIVVWLKAHPNTVVLSGMSPGRLYSATEPHPVSARRLGNSDLFYDVYNAAVLIDAQGRTAIYNKSKLVPGVELLPYEEVLAPLAIDLGGTSGSLGRQEERSALPVAGARVAPIICYESVYGDYVTGYVRNGADMLVIMTNDGWWDDSPGHLQHLAFGRLRAIETRRAIARCANTGISCFIDERGRIRQPTEWWKPAVIRQQVGINEEVTFFARYGDLIGRFAFWASHALVIVLVVLRLRKRRSM